MTKLIKRILLSAAGISAAGVLFIAIDAESGKRVQLYFLLLIQCASGKIRIFFCRPGGQEG